MGDTICAVATPPGHGGVGIVRVSGPRAPALAEALTGRVPQARHAQYARFRAADGTLLDEGIALYFPAPHSFTGEHVLELQGHGGPVVMDRLIAELVRLGARPARPGEFSERAFLNGKLDLAQAEAVADLIAATTEAGARAALRSLSGEFSGRIHELVRGLTDLRVYVEAAIDFPDEEGVEFLQAEAVNRRLDALEAQMHALLRGARHGQLLRDGMNVVIAGRPNAGKSSLLNRLAGYEAAIVTEIAGTTRDVLRERIQIHGMPLHVIDTAGLRDSPDPIEQEGIRRAHQAMTQADRVLLVIDDAQGLGRPERELAASLPPHTGLTVIRNKVDISHRPPGECQGELGTEIALSAQTGEGLDALREHLAASMGYQGGEGEFIARRRHLSALERAAEALAAAGAQRELGSGELMAEDLRAAQQALAEITGEFSSDDLLGEIFSSFCIGK
ncbi:tRNA uridine-5-carboxymethylaminomethyl(34) synthesis GTPase MnmE [Alkalilimnicola sp. S0819]|uniref:tRNA uridine-5-carboxymethylaminomethyl(34) synthesis GTPase MnmE n=1 Tax=Alkalilimnicola sp. S0819 TaxID=2613922 RepID=UPI0012623576|nr:tRNA uridine-5-carboxymethylaminomethyl(34) synthesis GTPase MnmE [Alkalilimnicola sp. S0819]KAB7624226.1 tRNA uridine-5-carboxymethylaminomethyl(34) synthesis GTPase MnmE [Alkalilimnicola sp. S0819]MPQ16481.1 tRNA uridine-5-carboxymethylaminomethyl(34) synthesis GTPase MnmE [Alkalilimnicola sp. S0819]